MKHVWIITARRAYTDPPGGVDGIFGTKKAAVAKLRERGFKRDGREGRWYKSAGALYHGEIAELERHEVWT